MEKPDIIKILKEKTKYGTDIHGYPCIGEDHIDDIADEILKQIKNHSDLSNVSDSVCSKCGMSDIDIKFQNVESKIYWSEHNEIENIKNFTRNDRYYSSDRIKRECLVHTCKTCGYKKAVAVADR